MTTQKKKILTIIKEYALMTGAAFLVAVVMRIFILPNTLVAGGFSGIASLIQYFSAMAGFEIPAQYSLFVLNVPLIVLAIMFLNRDFAFKSAYAVVVIFIFMQIITPETFAGIYENNVLIDIFIGGIFGGLSMHLAVEARGSNGGSEIIAWLVHKKNPESNIGRFLFMFNLFVIAVGGFASTSGFQFDRVIYSLIYSFVSSTSFNLFSRGVDPALRYVIISRKSAEIYQAFSARFKRGATSCEIYDADGNASDHTMLVVIIQHRQNITMKRLLKKIDPGCFAYAIAVDNVVTRPTFNRRYK